MKSHPKHLSVSLTNNSELELWVMELYFSEQMKHLEAPIVDFELRRPWKTGHASREGM